tara:strand:+ start:7434 stop:7649 length:216 start_codon:yes stop_codon:yes gene_type:complete
MSRKPNKIIEIESRLNHIEFALMNLMYIVANQEERLPDFKKSLDIAESMSVDIKKAGDFVSLMVNEEGAEA